MAHCCRSWRCPNDCSKRLSKSKVERGLKQHDSHSDSGEPFSLHVGEADDSSFLSVQSDLRFLTNSADSDLQQC
jgi:hypothetical protein